MSNEREIMSREEMKLYIQECVSEQLPKISEASRSGVTDAFAKIGVDINDKDEIRHFQANMMFVFRFRRLSEKVGATIILTAVTLITGGIVKLIWDGVKKGGG